MNPDELKHIGALRDLGDESLARLTAALEDRRFSDGEAVFAEGDPGDSMYFIAEGRIRIEKRSRAGSAAQKTLTVLGAGDYFGEMALLDQKPRSASAIASGSARLFRLSKAAFDQMQRAGSGAGLSVLFAMIRTSSDRIRRLSTQLVVYDEVGKAIGEARDLQELLDAILGQLLAASSADWGLFLLRSQFSDRLEIRGEAGLSLSPRQRDSVVAGEGILRQILQQPEFRIVADLPEEPLFKSCAPLGFETPSLLVAPILVESRLLGLILLGDHEPCHFDLDALNLARGVARQAAQALLNARHREEELARSRHSRQYVKF